MTHVTEFTVHQSCVGGTIHVARVVCAAMNYFLVLVFVFSLGLLIVWAENIPQKEDRVGEGSAFKPDHDHDRSLNYRFDSVENMKRETGAGWYNCSTAKSRILGRFEIVDK